MLGGACLEHAANARSPARSCVPPSMQYVAQALSLQNRQEASEPVASSTLQLSLRRRRLPVQTSVSLERLPCFCRQCRKVSKLKRVAIPLRDCVDTVFAQPAR